MIRNIEHNGMSLEVEFYAYTADNGLEGKYLHKYLEIEVKSVIFSSGKKKHFSELRRSFVDEIESRLRIIIEDEKNEVL